MQFDKGNFSLVSLHKTHIATLRLVQIPTTCPPKNMVKRKKIYLAFHYVFYKAEHNVQYHSNTSDLEYSSVLIGALEI